MKFMVSCRQPLVFLKDVTEIKVNYIDIERLADFVTDEWVSKADIVIYLPKDQMINWEQINSYKDILNIIIAVEDTSMIEVAHLYGYKSFWSYPASSFWELQGLLDLEVDQVLLDAPLYFELGKVKRICGDNVELRLVVNKCMNGYMQRKNGICGTYVRPEDITIYSEFIEHFEFDADNSLQKEYTLYHVYAQNGYWPGDLNILLTYLNEHVDNRGFEVVPVDVDDNKFFAHRRVNCGQICQAGGNCTLCPSTFNLINTISEQSEKLLQDIDDIDKPHEGLS